MALISVKQALAGGAQVNSKVEVRGWVRTRRDSQGGHLVRSRHDGSCQGPMQVVAPNTLANYASEVQRLTAGAR
jgi:asparaginyl-tRNA synthetase